MYSWYPLVFFCMLILLRYMLMALYSTYKCIHLDSHLHTRTPISQKRFELEVKVNNGVIVFAADEALM